MSRKARPHLKDVATIWGRDDMVRDLITVDFVDNECTAKSDCDEAGRQLVVSPAPASNLANAETSRRSIIPQRFDYAQLSPEACAILRDSEERLDAIDRIAIIAKGKELRPQQSAHREGTWAWALDSVAEDVQAYDGNDSIQLYASS